MLDKNDLETQMIRGQLNTHATLSNIAERINDIEAFAFGINDALIEQGILSSKVLYKQIEKVKKEILKNNESVDAGVVLRVDNEDFIDPEINCSERLHLCKSICCKLSFPLNAPEVESGELKWDLGRPYHIRQSQNGYCCHLGEEGKCTVYNSRPRVCKTYSCKEDQRIWKDFDNMVINEEWINANLTGGLPASENI